MDNETNLAAWMIAGGPRTVDPAETRNLGHRHALAAARPDRPGFVGRLAAAAVAAFRPAASTIGAYRPERAPVEPACCTA